MIKGFRFTNQLANAEIDARIHQEFLNKNDGIFYGMELSKTTNSITISEGLCEISGRPVAVIDSETITVGTESLYCILVLEIDLSKESTKDIFNQVSFKLLTSSVDYPTVTQQDINKYNGTNTIYQLEFARFRSGTNGITDFKDTRKLLSFSGIYAQIKSDCKAVIEQIKQELANVEDGSAYMIKNQFVTLYGTIKMPEANSGSLNGSLIFNYPEGFTKDNCVVISLMSHNTVNEDRWSTPISSQHSSVALLGNGDTEVILETDNIRIMSFKNDDAMPRNDVSFKITLMKLPVPEYTLGDVNDDGVIDEADYEIVKDYIMGNRVLTDKEFKAADMNNDYKINSGDTFLLIEKINGIE